MQLKPNTLIIFGQLKLLNLKLFDENSRVFRKTLALLAWVSHTNDSQRFLSKLLKENCQSLCFLCCFLLTNKQQTLLDSAIVILTNLIHEEMPSEYLLESPFFPSLDSATCHRSSLSLLANLFHNIADHPDTILLEEVIENSQLMLKIMELAFDEKLTEWIEFIIAVFEHHKQPFIDKFILQNSLCLFPGFLVLTDAKFDSSLVNRIGKCLFKMYSIGVVFEQQNVCENELFEFLESSPMFLEALNRLSKSKNGNSDFFTKTLKLHSQEKFDRAKSIDKSEFELF